MDHQVKDHVRFNNSNLSSGGDVFEPSSSNGEADGAKRFISPFDDYSTLD